MAAKKDKEESSSTELQVWKPESFAVLAADDKVEYTRAAIETYGLSKWKIKQLKVPAGGSLVWEVPVLTGVEGASHIDCVIVDVRPHQRSWWRSDPDEGDKTPPDCNSADGRLGYGNHDAEPAEDEWHECARCPWSEWGSSRREESRAQDCADKTHLFMYLEKGNMPALLQLPVTSLGNWSSYVSRLFDAGVELTSIVTRLTLEKHAQPVTHSRVKLDPVGTLDEAGRERAKALGAVIAQAFPPRRPSTQDLERLGLSNAAAAPTI